MENVRRHIVFKVIVYLALVSVTLMVLLGVLLFQYQRARAVRDLQFKAEQTGSRLANSLSYPLWNFNTAEIDKSISLEMPDRDVAAIILNNQANSEVLLGKIKTSGGSINNVIPNQAKLASLNKSFYVIKKPVTKGGETLGIINIYYTDASLMKELYTLLFQVLGLITLLLIASVVAIFWGIRRAVLSPLIRLTDAVKQAGENRFSTKVPVQSTDEIGTLALIFNKIIDQVAESYGVLEQRVKERTTALETQKDKAERERAKAEAILASIGDGLIVTDNSGRLLLLNQIAKQILRLEDTTIANKELITSITLNDEKGMPIPLEEHPVHIALQKRQSASKTLTLIAEDTSKRFLHITATPVIQNSSKTNSMHIIGAIAVIRDITRDHEVDRMKTEFISLASHQLRTPLSAIKWFSEILLLEDAGKLKSKQKEFVQNISDSTERMIQLVSSLLNISRIESGRIIIDPQPTDLKGLVANIVNDLQAKIQERKQKLIVNVHKDLSMINLDPRLIGQVYMNLLTNAIKYTPKGGEISVFVSKKGGKVISQITDNGYGVPKDQQSKLFQKFFRANNIIKVETDGTGLGLYLVKAIIESSKGEVWFESEEGKGTTFWFSLPITGMEKKAGEVTLET